VLHVRRVYVRGELKHEGKTPGSVPRRVPLSDRALAAVEAVPPRLDTPLIFPASRGGYIDLRNWRAREWIPAVRAAGFTTAEGKAAKRIYDLRHTFATFAIHALVPSFIIARVVGTSEAMLRKHYGHLLPDTDALVVERLNAYAPTEEREENAR
jgi:integrase